MVGAKTSMTTSSALDVMTLPQTPVIRQEYVPASTAVTPTRVSVGLSIPIGAAPTYHWYVNGPVPSALVVKVKSWPAFTVPPTGWVATLTGVLTMRVAGELVTIVHGLVTTQS